MEQCIKYVEIVVQQGVAMYLDAGKLEELAEIDRRRTGIHNSLIAKIAAVNRLCEGYGVEKVYNGGDHRREKGDFAERLVAAYFADRV